MANGARGPDAGEAALAARVIPVLEDQIQKGEALLRRRPLPRDAYGAWDLVTRDVLERSFGRDSRHARTVLDVGKCDALPAEATADWWEQHDADLLDRRLSRLRALVEIVRAEHQLGAGPGSSAGGAHEAGAPGARSRRVFLVHGHDHLALNQTARFLEKLGLETLVLRELPTRGRTVMEKFENYADVEFAVVLLTPDDRGGPASDPVERQRARARQNVVFELGYFLGRLGRGRVCALHRGDVEIPSDFAGVLYVPLDGEWRLPLAQELKAAGLPIDVNAAL
jgi:hypothetical protein